ncbi:MAG: hypothetical protein JW850_07495 [Thermoflexales bacterium]|nr:hypothetical protein [Thermoflexales bacterium]
MNTLSRAITAQLFDNTETYTALRKHWSARLSSDRKHELAAAHYLLYLALVGKDWRKGFTPPTNRRKLENGALVGWKLFRALDLLHRRANEEWLLTPFDGLVTPTMLQQLRELLPRLNPYAYIPEQFAGGKFPFEAYCAPEALHTPLSEGGVNV